MGKYKVFNGLDWVDISNCNLHIRNANNEWQLIDPANCTVRYWTGTEWCEIGCFPATDCCLTGEVVIGTQTWTCENLNVTTFRNGDPIPEVTDPSLWPTMTTPAWCYYNNDPANASYGRLYNHYALMDPRGIGPVGWRLPTLAEVITLRDYLGGEFLAGGPLKETCFIHWREPNGGATNSTCFSARAAGRMNIGVFGYINDIAMFQTCTDTLSTLYRNFSVQADDTYFGTDVNSNFGDALPARLIKDTCANIYGNDITIGTQTWTGKNLDVSTFRNGDPIPQVTDLSLWAGLTTPAWCYYNNDPAKGALYGKLYNWHAVNDPRGLAPVGYHVPSRAEWTTLFNYLGGPSVAGNSLKSVGSYYWYFQNAGSTNAYCFDLRGAGIVEAEDGGSFMTLRTYGNYWTTEANPTFPIYAYVARFNNNYGDASLTAVVKKTDGCSIRLIKD